MTSTAAPKPRRHRWVHPKPHVYVCRRCGTGKVNTQGEDGRWRATFYGPDGTQTRGLTPPCVAGPRTDAHLAKYGIEREAAA